MMNTYLTQSKIRLIKRAKQDLQDIYDIDYTPFTRKMYFYYFVLDGRKYVHKESLWFVYTNAETYTNDREPDQCDLRQNTVPPDVLGFLSSYQGALLPQLLEENDKFLVYEYFEGTHIDSITESEFFYLKTHHKITELTPFYNSMAYNMARNGDCIKLIDFKHFEPKDSKPFFIYLYNEDNKVNMLYIEKNTDIGSIFEHLAIDYPVEDAIIVEY